MNWKEKFKKRVINKKFIVGKYYKLRKDYPYFEEGEYVTFEGRTTWWQYDKFNGFKDGKIQKCVSVESHKSSSVTEVKFKNVRCGYWNYNPEDFVEVPQ